MRVPMPNDPVSLSSINQYIYNNIVKHDTAILQPLTDQKDWCCMPESSHISVSMEHCTWEPAIYCILKNWLSSSTPKSSWMAGRKYKTWHKILRRNLYCYWLKTKHNVLTHPVCIHYKWMEFTMTIGELWYGCDWIVYRWLAMFSFWWSLNIHCIVMNQCDKILLHF